ncbi:alpha/beta hydrolase [Pseudomonas sp. C9-3]|uniref:alpha/beta hydrolase n=1 Tax=Pseudomonas sp. C9-3 TaxID=3078264 RepID=UPI0039648B29
MLNHTSFASLEREPNTGLHYRKASNTANPEARLLLLHGVGSNEENLATIAPALPEGLEVILVRGPRQLGPQSFGWYQVTFTNEGPSFNKEEAEDSRQLLIQFIGALPKLPTVISGFSQGGIMSSSVGVTEPELVKGFALLSGRMLREIAPQIAAPDRLKSTSAFIAHGQKDGVLPATWAHEADAWLEKLGIAHETHFYDMAHQIVEQELADFSAWLKKILNLNN